MTAHIMHAKPAAFYPTFERKGPGQTVTHYCPGCGHGTVHKFIAEAIDALGVQDRTVFCSPVGCSVFAYYYFDCGNVQCAHGRAPAVATGIRRARRDAVVIAYQGDGDLAGIGMGGIVHAANRGENITVYFVNNAIYGMTGGQMAPTTLVGQKTATTPLGRSLANDGGPVGMAEIMNALQAPVFVERVSLADPGRTLRARKAIRQALENQVQKRGFSFEEILSPCPVNWKMSPVESRRWILEQLEPVFPVRNFRDRSAAIATPPTVQVEEHTDAEILSLFRVDRGDDWDIPPRRQPLADQYVKIAGFGGQGVMSAGVLLANCVIAEGMQATWLPSYGPEMRGGTANASVIVSHAPIGAPVVDTPNVLIAMNGPSLDAFEERVQPGGLVIVNRSLIDRPLRRTDLRVIEAPISDMGRDAGLIMTGNIVALALYAAASSVMAIDTLRAVIPVSIRHKTLIDVNLRALDAGVEFYRRHYPQGL